MTVLIYLFSAFVGGFVSAAWSRLVLWSRRQLRPGDLVRVDRVPGWCEVVERRPYDTLAVESPEYPDLVLVVGLSAVTAISRSDRP